MPQSKTIIALIFSLLLTQSWKLKWATNELKLNWTAGFESPLLTILLTLTTNSTLHNLSLNKSTEYIIAFCKAESVLWFPNVGVEANISGNIKQKSSILILFCIFIFFMLFGLYNLTPLHKSHFNLFKIYEVLNVWRCARWWHLWNIRYFYIHKCTWENITRTFQCLVVNQQLSLVVKNVSGNSPFAK